MKFAERLAEDRRLVILRLLSQTPGYSANESLIASALYDFGHAVSRDAVRTELHWLMEQGLLTIAELATVLVATLSQRGFETAEGIVSSPGVKRPAPKAAD